MKCFLLPRRSSYRLLIILPINFVFLVALAITIWFDNEFNRGIVFTPASTPISFADGPQIGVNTFNIHVEPDPTVITRTFKLAHDMGAHYVRMQVPWDDIEIHGRGDFMDRRNATTLGVISAWQKYDRIVETAVHFELELVLRLERAPNWSRPQTMATPEFQIGIAIDGHSTGPPDDYTDYATFVHTIVKRYRGKVRFFQLWNEPNLKNEWNWQEPHPKDLVKLLQVGYNAAKTANPEAVILFPSLAPTDGLDQRAPMTELEYLDAVYKAGGGAYFDIMSGQAYGLGQPPDEHRYIYARSRHNWSWRRPIDTRNDVSRIVLLREVMELNGDTHKAIWVGEFGWNSAPDSIPIERRLTWGQPVSEEQKAEYIINQIERARHEWPWMGVAHIWMLRYGGYNEPDPADPTPYFALVQRDWTLLPAYSRLQKYLTQPTLAGVGTHTWNHSAIETREDSWLLRFSGTRVTLMGDFARATEPTTALLDGIPITLIKATTDGQQTLTTTQLSDTVHTLEIYIHGTKAPDTFLVERTHRYVWVWIIVPLLIGIGLCVSIVATLQAFYETLDSIMAHITANRS